MNRTAFVLLSLLFSAIIGGYYITQSPEKTGITSRPAYPTEIYASKVKPLVQNWASDAELILVYGSEYCQQILCDVHPMSSPCFCNDSTFGDGKAPQWTFILYSKQKGELMKVDAYIVQEDGQKKWQIVSKKPPLTILASARAFRILRKIKPSNQEFTYSSETNGSPALGPLTLPQPISQNLNG